MLINMKCLFILILAVIAFLLLREPMPKVPVAVPVEEVVVEEVDFGAEQLPATPPDVIPIITF